MSISRCGSSDARTGRPAAPVTGPDVRVTALTSEPLGELVDIWNAAAGEAFPLRTELFQQNTVDDPNFDPAGCAIARAGSDGRIVGFCVAKVARVPLGDDELMPEVGWISMLAVHPSIQRRGVASALLEAGEAFVRGRRRRQILLGMDPGHFFPGVPAGSGAEGFFARAGYQLRGEAYDLHRSLVDYHTPAAVTAALAAHPDLEIRPLAPEEAAGLLVFLDDTFPGRWRYTVARYLELGGTVGDIMGVVRRGAVLGFAQLFQPGSAWIGPSIAWAGGRAAATGGLGPMGLSEEIRGRGLGLALLDRSVLHLARLGLSEMVIDWTILLDFYGALGFVPCREYRHGERRA